MITRVEEVLSPTYPPYPLPPVNSLENAVWHGTLNVTAEKIIPFWGKRERAKKKE